MHRFFNPDCPWGGEVGAQAEGGQRVAASGLPPQATNVCSSCLHTHRNRVDHNS